MTSSTVLGGLDGRLGDVQSRDSIDPVCMLDALMARGGDIEVAQRIVLAYMMRGVDHGGGNDSGTGLSSSSSTSSRAARSEKFFRDCDEWLGKSGFCYTAILRPSKRSECARTIGSNISLNTVLDLPASYVAWRKLESIWVKKVNDSQMHLSFIKSEGCESFMAHMASFIGDFPTVVSTAWLNSVRHVAPVEDGWFGLTTRFGALGTSVARVVRRGKALERGDFSKVGIECFDGCKEVCSSIDDQYGLLNFSKPTVVLAPIGVEIASSGLVIVTGLETKACVLVVGSVLWRIRGCPSHLVCIAFDRYERKADFSHHMHVVDGLEGVFHSSLGVKVPYVMFDSFDASSLVVHLYLDVCRSGFGKFDLDDVREGFLQCLAVLTAPYRYQVCERSQHVSTVPVVVCGD